MAQNFDNYNFLTVPLGGVSNVSYERNINFIKYFSINQLHTVSKDP